MKKHYFKRSELVLFLYDSLINGGITMRELIERTGVSVGTAYSLQHFKL